MNKYFKYLFYTVVTILIAVVFVQAAKHQGEPNTAKRADGPDQRSVGNSHSSTKPAGQTEPDSPYIDGVARMREMQFDFGYTPRVGGRLHRVLQGTGGRSVSRIVPRFRACDRSRAGARIYAGQARPYC